jgi:cytochrome c-type biogenesis protein CcmF
MNIGILATILALTLTLISTLYYFLATRDDNHLQSRKSHKVSDFEKKIKIGRLCFYLSTIMIFIAGIYLYYLILNHRFEFSYVYRYSSKDLPLAYLISTFWAGQEGSFLLWTIFIALMGTIFIRVAQEFEYWGMVIVNIVQGFFLLILLKATPFEVIGQIPSDGAGLNPLLQNLWMVIHPPVLFVGYAAITFPFAIAVAASIKNEQQRFVNKSLPWALFSSITLGAGIILGGFWAYVTLGWGGYWGWDPVENSSLIPWITIIALVHGLVVQNRTGSLKKSNYILAVLSFILVLYATFLTRSGILEDFSVHSFQNLGINSFLIIFMLASLIMGLTPFIKGIRNFSKNSIDNSSLNRENIILISIIVLFISALLIFLGTSSPIITGLFGDSSQVNISFYNNVNLPIAVVMCILLGLAPFLRWREKDVKSLLMNIIPSLIISTISCAIVVIFGIRNPVKIIFLWSAFFALWSNVIVFSRFIKFGWRQTGAPLSHIGVALLLAGIIISGTLQESDKVILKKNIPEKVFNEYELIYSGMIMASDGKDILNIKVKKGNQNYTAHPRFYKTKYNQSVMREPDVKTGLFYDLYISPLERRVQSTQFSQPNILVLQRGETKEIKGIQINFVDFDMNPHADTGPMKVGAKLEISDDNWTQEATPLITMGSTGQKSEPFSFYTNPETKSEEIKVTLNKINADTKTIELAFEGFDGSNELTAESELIILEFSKKPLINMVWLGTIFIIIGTVVALIFRTTSVETI